MKLHRASSLPPKEGSVMRVPAKGAPLYEIDPNCGCPKIKKSTTP